MHPHPHREEKFTIRTADLDSRSEVSPVVLFSLLQELAINHADELGVGLKSIIEGSGHTWMLSRMRIVFAPTRPKFGEEIRVLTWPAGVQGRAMALRCFRVRDTRDAEILRAETEWFYVNIARQRIARLPDTIMEIAPRTAPRVELPEMSEKFEFDDTADLFDTAEIRVRRADLDINNHVNHTHIIAWLFESLADISDRPLLRTMDIVFRQEARLGDTLVSAASRGHSHTFHKISRADTTIAQAVLTWG